MVTSQIAAGKKLVLSSAATLGMVTLLGVAAWLSVGALGTSVNHLAKVTGRNLYLSGLINADMSDTVSEIRQLLIGSLLQNRPKMAVANQEFQATSARLVRSLDEQASLVETAEGKRLIADIKNSQTGIIDGFHKLNTLLEKDEAQAAIQFETEELLPLVTGANKKADQLATQQNGVLSAATLTADSTVLHARWAVAICFVFALVISIPMGLVIRHINRTLTAIATELSEGAQQIGSAASQVAASSQALAQAASEQAASLEETSASSEEVNAMARKNGQSTSTAAGLVGSSAEKFQHANQSLDEMISAMSSISTSSDGICKIIKVIDEVAFQTNILALNAAVEAARAGEAGMGFAVVAEEVRNLAQRCSRAAQDTHVLIEDSIAKSNEGQCTVRKLAEAIQRLTAESTKVRAVVEEIQVSSREQERGIDQIGLALSQIERVTQTNASNAEETASAAEQLHAHSGTLKHLVTELQVLVHGH